MGGGRWQKAPPQLELKITPWKIGLSIVQVLKMPDIIENIVIMELTHIPFFF